MSQLYELENGGIGHYDEWYDEKVFLMLKHLSFKELIICAEKLKKLGNTVFANEKEILSKAIDDLKEKSGLEEVGKATRSIAEMVGIEGRNFNAEAEKIILEFVKMAKKRGYVDKHGFFRNF